LQCILFIVVCAVVSSFSAPPAACRLRKTLVLDLDETLVHSTFLPPSSSHAGLVHAASQGSGSGSGGSGSGASGGSGSGSGFGGVFGRFGGGGQPPASALRVHVVLDGVPCTFHVHVRPHVRRFLTTVAEWYEVVVFTASLRKYADPVIDALGAWPFFFFFFFSVHFFLTIYIFPVPTDALC
jgi:CTD nuclear envelope phosphatase 1